MKSRKDYLFDLCSYSSKAPPSKIKMIIEELMDIEKRYIFNLRTGIETYIVPFKSLPLPQSLEGRRFDIFINIEQIREFHETKLLPRLINSGHDPQKIGEVFVELIDSGLFDCYITYVANSDKSLAIHKEHKYFFAQLDRDRLGISSFLLQPVQILPRYRLIFSELVKELFNNDCLGNKAAIKSCFGAESKLHKLLTIVNGYKVTE